MDSSETCLSNVYVQVISGEDTKSQCNANALSSPDNIDGNEDAENYDRVKVIDIVHDEKSAGGATQLEANPNAVEGTSPRPKIIVPSEPVLLGRGLSVVHVPRQTNLDGTVETFHAMRNLRNWSDGDPKCTQLSIPIPLLQKIWWEYYSAAWSGICLPYLWGFFGLALLMAIGPLALSLPHAGPYLSLSVLLLLRSADWWCWLFTGVRPTLTFVSLVQKHNIMLGKQYGYVLKFVEHHEIVRMAYLRDGNQVTADETHSYWFSVYLVRIEDRNDAVIENAVVNEYTCRELEQLHVFLPPQSADLNARPPTGPNTDDAVLRMTPVGSAPRITKDITYRPRYKPLKQQLDAVQGLHMHPPYLFAIQRLLRACKSRCLSEKNRRRLTQIDQVYEKTGGLWMQ
jgi:hypothetical protein